MTTTTPLTAEDLKSLDGDGNHYDLVRGELICLSPTGERHGEVAANIAAALWNHVKRERLGKVYIAEAGFILARNPDVVLAPDASFVRAGRLPADRDQDRFLPLAPDLAVEVVSPSDRAGYVSDKVIEYLDAGTRLLWLVEPRRKIVTVYTTDRTARVLGEQDTLDGGDVLPGFRLPIAELFS